MNKTIKNTIVFTNGDSVIINESNALPLKEKVMYKIKNSENGKIGVNGTAYRSNRNTYRLKRYTFPHIINLYFYCFPPFAILMM